MKRVPKRFIRGAQPFDQLGAMNFRLAGKLRNRAEGRRGRLRRGVRREPEKKLERLGIARPSEKLGRDPTNNCVFDGRPQVFLKHPCTQPR